MEGHAKLSSFDHIGMDPKTAPILKGMRGESGEPVELEDVWKEYIDRQNKANNANIGYSIGGSILALAFTGFTGGVGTALLAGGGGILGRYLGQQASNKIRNDLTYEDAFLQTYACPRCKESFQKKPWITVRECLKCKIKFR